MTNKHVNITREFNFAMAHCLPNHCKKCRFIHGHNYKMFVTVGTSLSELNRSKTKESTDYGMVMDFGDLNKIVNELIIDKYDHSLVLWKEYISNMDGFKEFIDSLTEEECSQWNIHIIPYRPTAENMCVDYYNILHKYFIKETDYAFYIKVKIYENDKSYAEYGDM